MPKAKLMYCQSLLKSMNNQIMILMIAGMGNKGILNGLSSPRLEYRQAMTPTACDTNCMSIRMTMMAVITSFILNSRLKMKASPPNASNDTCGKCNLGCTLAKTLKKSPFFAAA